MHSKWGIKQMGLLNLLFNAGTGTYSREVSSGLSRVNANDLGFSQDPTQFNQVWKGIAEHEGILPDSVTAEDVLRKEGEASALEAQVFVQGKYAAAAAKQMRAAAQLHGIHSRHAQARMQVATQFAKTDAQFGIAAAKYGLDMGAAKTQLNAYQQSLQNASSRVGF
jgi:hypothetical protein